jgi:hypothetical protein
MRYVVDRNVVMRRMTVYSSEGRLPFFGRMQVVYSRGAHQIQVLVQNFFDQNSLLSALERIYRFVFPIRTFRAVTIYTYALCGSG